MSDLDYTLAVLTHGDSGTIDRTVASFFDKVKPAPARVIVYKDGGESERQWTIERENGWIHRLGGDQRGFCAATGSLWSWAVEQQTEFVFWLEHDFTFLRPVDLRELAAVLDADPELAQMQLMRNAVSRDEIAAGGLYEMRRADYERVVFNLGLLADPLRFYLRHGSYFSTNPSLMRTEFMVENPWPDDGQPECEGRFGIDLVGRGFRFGVWGAGEPWVEHIGVRSGRGY